MEDETNRLVTKNMDLVEKAVNRYRDRVYSSELDDIRSDAMFGLFKVARAYRAGTGENFKQLARSGITKAIYDGFRKRDHLSRSHRKEVGDGGPRCISLNSLEFAAVYEDENLKAVDDRDAVEFLLKGLGRRAKRLIRLRFWKNMTYEQIAKHVGPDKKRVINLVKSALQTMRNSQLSLTEIQ